MNDVYRLSIVFFLLLIKREKFIQLKNRTRNDREDKAWNDRGHKLIAFMYNKTRSPKKKNLPTFFSFLKDKQTKIHVFFLLIYNNVDIGQTNINLPSGYWANIPKTLVKDKQTKLDPSLLLYIYHSTWSPIHHPQTSTWNTNNYGIEVLCFGYCCCLHSKEAISKLINLFHLWNTS